MGEITQKQRIGRLGEDIAVKYLENKGFLVVERNFLRKCGEIDIIAQKGKKLHFIEVKSVSHVTTLKVTHETDIFRAEDNIHEFKLKRLAKTIQLYLVECFPKEEPDWQLDAIIVRLDPKLKLAKVKYLKNIGI